MPDLLMPDWEQLTAEEEAELAGRMQAGDREARDRLVLSQYPWLKTIARRYVRRHFPLPDLFQHAIIELMQCLETFDPGKGRLSTYIASPLGWRLYRLIKCHRLIYRPYKVMPAYREQHEKARRVGEFGEDAQDLFSDGRESPDNVVAEAEQHEHERGMLHDAIAQIQDPRRQRILRRRLAGQTLAAIGKTEQITREAVRQHEKKALQQIRQLLAA